VREVVLVIKKRKSEIAFDISNIIFMIILMIITIYPFIYVTAASFSESKNLVGQRGIMILPKGFTISSYKMVFKNPNILTGYRNTLIVLVGGTFVNIIMTSFGAYVLSRKQFAIKKAMMIMIVFTMYFSGGLIPTYLLVYNTLKLGNNLLALILPSAISTWNLIVMRTYFLSVPDSLEESARIDGANDFVILFRIILPVSLPVVAVMILFYGVGHWNSWFSAMIYLRDRELYPIQLILREILILSSTDSMMIEATDGTDREAIGESIKYATILVATVPVLFIYPFFQKYFVKGVMIGALKG